MEAAILNFLQLDKTNKVLVIGDMFELGLESIPEHQKIVDLLLSTTDVDCYLIGKDFFASKVKNTHLHFFEVFDDFSTFIKQKPFGYYQRHRLERRCLYFVLLCS